MSTDQNHAVLTQPTSLTDDDVRIIRQDFPALDQKIHGRRLVYLDSGATSQKPRVVLDAEREFHETSNAAVHRGAHELAVRATDAFEDARTAAAAFVGAAPEQLVWTANATAGINLIAHALGNASVWAERGRGDEKVRQLALKPRDEIVVTGLEHHANLIPWQELAFRTGAVLRFIPVDHAGSLRMDEAEHLIGPRTKVVAFSHASNVLGSITPVRELVHLARRAGALVVLDACQSAPHMPLDLPSLDVDFAVFSAHKMLGPTGVGVLYGRRSLLNALPPVHTGGSMITTVTMERAEYMAAPQRFEAGTQPIGQAVGLAAAVNYLDKIGMSRIHSRVTVLGQRLAEGITTIKGVRLLGPPAGEPRTGLAAFDVEGVHAHDVGQYLDSLGIAVRVGHHCAQPLHHQLGLSASTRASAYLYNTTDDIDEFLTALSGVRPYFGVGK